MILDDDSTAEDDYLFAVNEMVSQSRKLLPAKVVAVNGSLLDVEVQLDDIILVLDVAVADQSGCNFRMQYNIAVGCAGYLTFSSCALYEYVTNGKLPDQELTQTLSDSVFVPCAISDGDKFKNQVTGATMSNSDGSTKTEWNDGNVTTTIGTTSLSVTDSEINGTVGATSVNISASEVLITVGGSIFSVKDGVVEITSTSLLHNGVNVGSTHKHLPSQVHPS